MPMLGCRLILAADATLGRGPGYSALAGAFARMGGLFFPDAAEELDERAWRATRSRA